MVVKEAALGQQLILVIVDAGMKPGAGFYGRGMEGLVVVNEFLVVSMEARPCEIVKSFGVKLVHTSEPSKFTFSAVKIAVVIFVGGDQLGLANVVNDLNLFHHLDGKGQVGGPVETIFFVFQVKLGGGGVLDAGGGPQVVVHLNQ